MAEVEYASADGLAGTVRPAGLIPRNERAFAFDGHGTVGGMADALGRLAAICDDDSGPRGDTFTEYAYLGIGRIVQENYPEPEVRLDYDSGTPAREEDWALDMTGNWPGFVQKTSGSTDLDQGRTHNPVNEITATWTNTRSASTYANVTLYTGRELDGETGLYYYRNRYYSAELGRFSSRDPMSYEANDENLYAYIGAGPVVATDPTGLHFPWPPNYPQHPTGSAGRWCAFWVKREKEKNQQWLDDLVACPCDRCVGLIKTYTSLRTEEAPVPRIFFPRVRPRRLP